MTIWQGLGLAASSLLILLAAPSQYFGRQHDDIIYLVASQSLSQGSYRLLTTPGLPLLTMTSPGFPALLLPLALIFGEWVPAYQAFCCLVLATGPWIIWKWLRSELGPDQACLAAVVFGTSPLVLSQSGTVMPEAVYTVLAILLVGSLAKARFRGAGALLVALTQLRPAGLSLLPAVLARPLKERRWTDAGMASGPALLGLGAWWLWAHSAGGVQEARELSLSYAGGNVSHGFMVSLDNARYYLSSWGSCHLPAGLAEGPAGLAVGCCLMALVLAGLARKLKADPTDPNSLLLLAAFAMHLVWTWHYERYLVTLLPWLLWALAGALKTRATAVLAVLLATQTVFHSHRFLRTSPWSAPELSRTYAWIASSGQAPEGLIASPLYVRDGWYTARPSIPLPDDAASADFAAELRKRRAGLVLWQESLDIGTSLSRSSQLSAKLAAAGRHLEDRRFFTLVYENAAEGSKIYALK
ncbi:MAG: hypothetical protein HY924_13615 [Elusimicrobia bacterium]|nr:hypothetical protein [Elusimicrobiota bacterium]